MSRLLRSLTTQELPLWRYCLAMWPVALIPAVAVQIVIQLVSSHLPWGDLNSHLEGAPKLDSSLLVGALLKAPLLETAIMAILLELLSILTKRRMLLALGLGLVAGVLHVLYHDFTNFLPSLWAFFVFASAYLTWRSRSIVHGFTAAAVPHFLGNLTGMVLLAFQVQT